MKAKRIIARCDLSDSFSDKDRIGRVDDSLEPSSSCSRPYFLLIIRRESRFYQCCDFKSDALLKMAGPNDLSFISLNFAL